LFTEIVLEALTGKASGKNEYVKVIDIMYHVLREVPERIKEYNDVQNPVINEVKDLNGAYCVCLNGHRKLKTKSFTDHQNRNDEADELIKIDFIKSYPKKVVSFYQNINFDKANKVVPINDFKGTFNM
jgi:hypothetical protein